MASQTIRIRSFTKADYPACAKIYKEGLNTGIATFETQVPNWKKWNEKFLKACRLMAVYNTVVAGWCALSPFSQNKASIALHEKCGFRIVGIRERLGKRNGIWYDNVLMERRSYLN